MGNDWSSLGEEVERRHHDASMNVSVAVFGPTAPLDALRGVAAVRIRCADRFVIDSEDAFVRHSQPTADLPAHVHLDEYELLHVALV